MHLVFFIFFLSIIAFHFFSVFFFLSLTCSECDGQWGCAIAQPYPNPLPSFSFSLSTLVDLVSVAHIHPLQNI